MKLPLLPKQSAPAVSPDGYGNLTLTVPLYRSLQNILSSIEVALGSAPSSADVTAIEQQLAGIDRVIGPIVNVGGNGFLTYYNNVYNVRSFLGTSNRVTVSNGSGGGNVSIDIDASYVGQTSITTVGTISTGTWNGTTIAIAHGGTGATTANAAFAALSPMTTDGDLITRSGSVPSRLGAGTSGYVLTSNGPGAAPSWMPSTSGQKVLPVVNGDIPPVLVYAEDGSLIYTEI